ncbi:hypothetical protein A3715_35735 [Oleiphilus sp. HI0009]|nr:hypothetical protein A3715_11435 [Oleiphilus sp. HI0009]KZX81266.1 hypothetical protein A3715_35735 [Oleiphilus sp. HI0009]
MNIKVILEDMERLKQEAKYLYPLRKHEQSLLYKMSKWPKNDLVLTAFLIATLGGAIATTLAGLKYSLGMPVAAVMVMILFLEAGAGERAIYSCAEGMKQNDIDKLSRILRDFASSKYATDLDNKESSKYLVRQKPLETALALHSVEQYEKVKALGYLFSDMEGTFSFRDDINKVSGELKNMDKAKS